MNTVFLSEKLNFNQIHRVAQTGNFQRQCFFEYTDFK